MARGGRVKGIRVKGPLRENAQRIIAFRLNELVAWRHAIADPTQVTDLHNLRIAAKRLRYALEIFELCFPSVKPILQRLTDLQEDVGDIHDLDVLIDMLRVHLARIDANTERLAVEVMNGRLDPSEQSNRLRAILYAQARDRRRLGLIGLLGSNIVKRDGHFIRFQDQWGGVAMDALRVDLFAAIDLPAAVSIHLSSEEALSLAKCSETSLGTLHTEL